MCTQGIQSDTLLHQTFLAQSFNFGIKYNPCTLLCLLESWHSTILALVCFGLPGPGGAASLVWVIVAGLYDRATLHPPQGSDLLRYHSALSPHLVDIIPPLIYTQVDIKSGLVGSDDKPILLWSVVICAVRLQQNAHFLKPHFKSDGRKNEDTNCILLSYFLGKKSVLHN